MRRRAARASHTDVDGEVLGIVLWWSDLGKIESLLIGLLAFTLKERVGFQRFLDDLLQIDSTHLQQLNGLLQLWCEGELLPESELKRLFHTADVASRSGPVYRPTGAMQINWQGNCLLGRGGRRKSRGDEGRGSAAGLVMP